MQGGWGGHSFAQGGSEEAGSGAVQFGDSCGDDDLLRELVVTNRTVDGQQWRSAHEQCRLVTEGRWELVQEVPFGMGKLMVALICLLDRRPRPQPAREAEGGGSAGVVSGRS